MVKKIKAVVFVSLLIVLFAGIVEARDLKPIYEIPDGAPIKIAVKSIQDETKTNYGTWDINVNIENIGTKVVKAIELQFIPQNDFGKITTNSFETTTSEILKPSQSSSQTFNTRGDLTTTQVLVRVKGVLFTDGTKWPSSTINIDANVNEAEYKSVEASKALNAVTAKDINGKVKIKAIFLRTLNNANEYAQYNVIPDFPKDLILLSLTPRKPTNDLLGANIMLMNQANNFAISKSNSDVVFNLAPLSTVEIYGEFHTFEQNEYAKYRIFIINKIVPVPQKL